MCPIPHWISRPETTLSVLGRFYDCLGQMHEERIWVGLSCCCKQRSLFQYPVRLFYEAPAVLFWLLLPYTQNRDMVVKKKSTAGRVGPFFLQRKAIVNTQGARQMELRRVLHWSQTKGRISDTSSPDGNSRMRQSSCKNINKKGCPMKCAEQINDSNLSVCWNKRVDEALASSTLKKISWL